MPIWLMPMSVGRNKISGTMNLSLFIRISCSPSSGRPVDSSSDFMKPRLMEVKSGKT